MAVIKKSYNDHSTLRGALRDASEKRKSREVDGGRKCSKCDNIMPIKRKQAQCVECLRAYQRKISKLRSQRLW